ncbi:MAG TPA: LptF/LptG family permease [Caulobacteraceae bacterium]|jgi:lipopolysaccharide export system permease protein
MTLVQRYFFRQLLGPAAVATLALTGVALLSQSLGQLEIIVEQRQTAAIYAKIIALSLPQLFSLILPIAVFVASLVALNRLHTEQEIVICFASGMSRWAVISPAVRLAALAALVVLVLNLWASPFCARLMREEVFKVRTDLAAVLVREGEFNQPAPGLIVYAQRVDPNGRLTNVFIQRQKPDGGAETFDAREAVIVTTGAAPALILRHGSSQDFDSDGVLNYLEFDENVFDLAPYLNTEEKLVFKISDRYLHELVFPDLRHDWERWNRTKMLAEAHYRLSAPLYTFTFVGLALAAVLGGSFSRLGYARRIAITGAVAATLRIVGFGVQAACDDVAWLNVLQYAVPLGGAYGAYAQVVKRRIGGVSLGIPMGGGAELKPLGAPA